MTGLLDRATEFTFFVVPPDHRLRRQFVDMNSYRVVVAWRGNRDGEDQDRWAILRDGAGICWTAPPSVRARNPMLGRWEYEPSPSSRNDRFIRRARWTRDEAVILAEQLCVLRLAELEERHP